MALKITEILEILKDGKWHSLDEIQTEMHLNRNQIQQVIAFLREYRFVIISETQKKIRIEEEAKKFMTQRATS